MKATSKQVKRAAPKYAIRPLSIAWPPLRPARPELCTTSWQQRVAMVPWRCTRSTPRGLVASGGRQVCPSASWGLEEPVTMPPPIACAISIQFSPYAPDLCESSCSAHKKFPCLHSNLMNCLTADSQKYVNDTAMNITAIAMSRTMCRRYRITGECLGCSVSSEGHGIDHFVDI